MPVVRSLADRFFSIGKQPKTSVLFLHFGQPKNAFYAREFLHRIALDFYGLPSRLSSLVPSSFYLKKKINKCVDEYDQQERIEQIVDRLSQSVESSLQRLVPEFGPVSCHFSFPYESNSLEQDIRNISTRGTDRIILFPLYGHYSCSQVGLLLNRAARTLFNTTSSAIINGKSVDSNRFIPNTEISFEVSAIHRWHYHPSLSDMWSDQLNQIKDDFDAVVFSSPAMRGFGRKEYSRSVWTTCDKTMQKLDTNVPWSLGFYNSWNEACLPLKESLSSQIRRLAGKHHTRRRVAVVPITELFPTFDTFALLPSIVAKEADSFVVHPPSSSEIVVHGLAEVLKNHLLGRRDAQLGQFCPGCKKKDCEYSRLILA